MLLVGQLLSGASIFYPWDDRRRRPIAKWSVCAWEHRRFHVNVLQGFVHTIIMVGVWMDQDKFLLC